MTTQGIKAIKIISIMATLKVTDSMSTKC